jgi:hypothetical protein
MQLGIAEKNLKLVLEDQAAAERKWKVGAHRL